MPDYIPDNDAAFDRFFSFMIEYVDQKCGGNRPEWEHIPSEPRNVLTAAYGVWEEAYNRMKVPHTPVDTAAKNGAKKAGKTLIRPFVNQYLRVSSGNKPGSPGHGDNEQGPQSDAGSQTGRGSRNRGFHNGSFTQISYPGQNQPGFGTGSNRNGIVLPDENNKGVIK